MTKDYESFESSTNCWICNDTFVKGDAKVRDLRHFTRKYRSPAQRDCNINASLTYKIPIVFHNLKNYDAYVIMQVLDKFNFKINVIPNGFEKCMSFSLDDKLVFINKFQFLSSSLEKLVKNLGENNCIHLSLEFDSEVLDLVK